MNNESKNKKRHITYFDDEDFNVIGLNNDQDSLLSDILKDLNLNNKNNDQLLKILINKMDNLNKKIIENNQISDKIDKLTIKIEKIDKTLNNLIVDNEYFQTEIKDNLLYIKNDIKELNYNKKDDSSKNDYFS